MKNVPKRIRAGDVNQVDLEHKRIHIWTASSHSNSISRYTWYRLPAWAVRACELASRLSGYSTDELLDELRRRCS